MWHLERVVTRAASTTSDTATDFDPLRLPAGLRTSVGKSFSPRSARLASPAEDAGPRLPREVRWSPDVTSVLGRFTMAAKVRFVLSC